MFELVISSLEDGTPIVEKQDIPRVAVHNAIAQFLLMHLTQETVGPKDLDPSHQEAWAILHDVDKYTSTPGPDGFFVHTSQLFGVAVLVQNRAIEEKIVEVLEAVEETQPKPKSKPKTQTSKPKKS